MDRLIELKIWAQEQSVSMVITSPDEHCEVLFINDEFESLSNYKLKDLIGKSLSIIQENSINQVNVDKWAENLENKRAFCYDQICLKKTEDKFFARMTNIPIFLSGNWYYLFIFNEISEKSNLISELNLEKIPEVIRDCACFTINHTHLLQAELKFMEYGSLDFAFEQSLLRIQEFIMTEVEGNIQLLNNMA